MKALIAALPLALLLTACEREEAPADEVAESAEKLVGAEQPEAPKLAQGPYAPRDTCGDLEGAAEFRQELAAAVEAQVVDEDDPALRVTAYLGAVARALAPAGLAVEPVPGELLDHRTGTRFGCMLLADGRAYWYALVPFHVLIFKRMCQRIAHAAGGEVDGLPETASAA